MLWTAVAVLGIGCTTQPPAVESRYDVLGLGELPIGLWVTPPDEFRNAEAFGKIADCGINFVNGFAPCENDAKEIALALDLCERAGLRYFVNRTAVHESIKEYALTKDSALLDQFVQQAGAYVDHPAYAGELLMDEPGKPLIESVSAFTKAYACRYPDHHWHVNLFPTYATGGIQTPSYEDYIDTWLEMTDPKFLSYDSYPLLRTGGIIPDYFYNMDMIRAKTRERKIPFWTFVQTLSIGNTPGVPDKREPSRVDIRWQVWSNLAFGSKGIQYFCYWSPGNGSELFSDAFITREGVETEKYGYVKQLNSDISKIGQILLSCDPTGVIQCAKEPFELYAPPISCFGPLERVGGDDCLAGCFVGQDGRYRVLICPLTPESGAQVSLSVAPKIKRVTIHNNDKEQTLEVENSELSLDIAAGDAVLVEF